MNIESILEFLNRHEVAYLLIGGVNFLLRHQPVATFDVDIWIRDDRENRLRCEGALREMNAEWGPTDAEWGLVEKLPEDWMSCQSLYCLVTRFGPLDVFRALKGLSSWNDADARASDGQTASGIRFRSLSDADMLACQLALEPPDQKLDRIRYLRAKLGSDA